MTSRCLGPAATMQAMARLLPSPGAVSYSITQSHSATRPWCAVVSHKEWHP